MLSKWSNSTPVHRPVASTGILLYRIRNHPSCFDLVAVHLSESVHYLRLQLRSSMLIAVPLLIFIYVSQSKVSREVHNFHLHREPTARLTPLDTRGNAMQVSGAYMRWDALDDFLRGTMRQTAKHAVQLVVIHILRFNLQQGATYSAESYVGPQHRHAIHHEGLTRSGKVALRGLNC
eukprot:scaffold501_cov407-Prasinococcus_capsulatus_cf.AAC.8